MELNLRAVREDDLAMFRRFGIALLPEFRAGQWRDGLLYSRLRDDPAPDL
jgi:ribosomal-protein-alanine N-acetyltransferase